MLGLLVSEALHEKRAREKRRVSPAAATIETPPSVAAVRRRGRRALRHNPLRSGRVAGEHREADLSRVRRIAAPLARVVVAALVLAYLVSRVDLARVWSAMRDAPVTATVEAFALWMIGWWIVSSRLALLMRAQGTRMTTFEALRINLAAVFYGLFVPGGELTGAAVRVHRLSGATGHYTAGVLGMAIDRVASTAAVCVTGFACWALDAHDKPAAVSVAFVVGAGMVAAAIAPFAAWRQRRRLTAILHMRGLRWTYAPVRRAVRELDVIARLPGRTIALLFFLSCLSQVSGVAAYAILAHALGLSLSLLTLGWVRSVVMIVTALPISVAGLGVREGALLLILRPYGVADHDTFALSLLVFAVTIVGAGLMGGVLEAFRWLAPRGGLTHVTE